MENINIYKAQRVVKEKPIEDVFISIKKELPALDGKRARLSNHIFKKEAWMIADALYASLPGGTIDALLIEMLDRKKSNLQIKSCRS